MPQKAKAAILAGGGPAPGINSVIAAASIRLQIEGLDVIGIQDGFEWIMQGNIDHVIPLTTENVSRVHVRGGSFLSVSRANPTKDAQHLETTIASLLRLNVSQLITIGGDDTVFSAMKLAEKAGGRIRIVHVPKTIDNDLDLPQYVDTFGYQTARHVGVGIVKNLMVDAKTTSRWYLVVSMGRKAGHLALGIGKAAGATMTLIPEEVGNQTIPMRWIVDTLVGSIICRLSEGRRDGVAVVAEGLVLSLDPKELAAIDVAERDAHGHVRISEIKIGDVLKEEVDKRLQELGIDVSVVAKDIGYELRCAQPIPLDMEYARDLGYCAAKYLLEGQHTAMISIQGGQFMPVPFESLFDPETGRAKVRLVDINSARYQIGRRYMIRVRRDHFDDALAVAKFAMTAGLSPEEFCKQFEYLTQLEPPPLRLSRNLQTNP